MKPLHWIVFFCICLTLSCRKDDGFTGIGHPTFIWDTRITGLVGIQQPILYKNKVYFITRDELSSTSLVALDKQDGRKLTETITTPTVQSDWDYSYQYENGLIFVNRNGIHFFDLETAAFKWTIPERIYNFKGIDSLLFGVRANQLLKINLLTKTLQVVQNLNSMVNFWNTTTFFDVYKNEQEQICLATASFRDSLNPVITVKNLNTNTTITTYEVPKLGLEGGFAAFFKVFKNKLYYGCSIDLLCRDLMSGNLDWSKDYRINGNAIGTEAFFGTNELFIGPYGCRELVALDLKTGNRIWGVPNDVNLVGFGSMENFYYFNKTLYWGSGNMNAIDGATGKVIWSFKAEFAKPSFQFSGLPCGEGDKLYLTSNSKALCIRPAQ